MYVRKRGDRDRDREPKPKMEPITAPAAESPANLTRQTRGGLLEATSEDEEEVIKLGLGLALLVSISESESVLDEEFDGVAISLSIYPEKTLKRIFISI